jgi:hypothetical protein
MFYFNLSTVMCNCCLCVQMRRAARPLLSPLSPELILECNFRPAWNFHLGRLGIETTLVDLAQLDSRHENLHEKFAELGDENIIWTSAFVHHGITSLPWIWFGWNNSPKSLRDPAKKKIQQLVSWHTLRPDEQEKLYYNPMELEQFYGAHIAETTAFDVLVAV